MKRTILKFAIGGVVLVSAIAYLAYAGLKDGGWTSYHLPVDTFLADAKFHAQRVRLAGKVAEEGLVRGAAGLGVQFILQGEKQRLPVSYAGAVPEMFKAGGEVIVEGRLDSAGTFQAQSILTKCASKYEAKDHPQKPETSS